MQYHIWDCPLLELLDPSRKLSRLGLPIDVAACYPTHLSSGSYSDYRANPSSKTLRDIVIYPICAPDLYARLEKIAERDRELVFFKDELHGFGSKVASKVHRDGCANRINGLVTRPAA